MHYLYALARLFPFWAVPLAVVIAELGRYYRRRNDKNQWVCWGSAGLLCLLTLLWLIFRGDVNSDAWMKQILGQY